MTKEEMQAVCEARGIPFNKRWGATRLEEAIFEADLAAEEAGNTPAPVEGDDIVDPPMDEDFIDGDAQARDERIAELEATIAGQKDEIADLKRRLSERAAKAQAAALNAPPKENKSGADLSNLKDGHVVVRVLRAGHGKLSTGEYDAFGRENKWAKGGRFACPIDRAEELERRGFVEIEGDED